MMTLQEKIAKISKYQVLFVEDEQDLIDIISNTLGKLQIKNFTASNGKIGLEIFRTNPEINVVVTDINMPVMDGLEMIREIRKTDQNIKIIIMSAHNESEFKEEAKKLGINDYLVKPFDFMQFIEIIFNLE